MIPRSGRPEPAPQTGLHGSADLVVGSNGGVRRAQPARCRTARPWPERGGPGPAPAARRGRDRRPRPVARRRRAYPDDAGGPAAPARTGTGARSRPARPGAADRPPRGAAARPVTGRSGAPGPGARPGGPAGADPLRPGSGRPPTAHLGGLGPAAHRRRILPGTPRRPPGARRRTLTPAPGSGGARRRAGHGARRWGRLSVVGDELARIVARDVAAMRRDGPYRPPRAEDLATLPELARAILSGDVVAAAAAGAALALTAHRCRDGTLLLRSDPASERSWLTLAIRGACGPRCSSRSRTPTPTCTPRRSGWPCGRGVPGRSTCSGRAPGGRCTARCARARGVPRRRGGARGHRVLAARGGPHRAGPAPGAAARLRRPSGAGRGRRALAGGVATGPAPRRGRRGGARHGGAGGEGDDPRWAGLLGRRNVAGLVAAHAGTEFVHVELSRSLRRDPHRREGVATAIAGAVTHDGGGVPEHPAAVSDRWGSTP